MIFLYDPKSDIVEIDESLSELIPGFLENRKRDAEILLAACQVGDIETLKSKGHTLKGVCGSYGFEKLSALGAQIETQANSESIEQMIQTITTFKDFLNSVEVRYVPAQEW